jgi:hypothetical protein
MQRLFAHFDDLLPMQRPLVHFGDLLPKQRPLTVGCKIAATFLPRV